MKYKKEGEKMRISKGELAVINAKINTLERSMKYLIQKNDKLAERKKKPYEIFYHTVVRMPDTKAEVGVSEVSFQLPCHDWDRLKESDEWHQVENFLKAIRTEQIQKLRQEQEEKSEKEEGNI